MTLVSENSNSRNLFLPILGMTLCLSLTQIFDAHAADFGTRGRDGQPGQNGYEGRPGASIVVRQPSPTAQYFNLSGEDGLDASAGEYGENANYCQQPFPNYSIRGADGGSGGSGGTGGNGGNGGDLTVYTSDIEFLRNLSVVSEGGRPGRGAQGGFGGQGCVCSTPSWTRQFCAPPRPNTPPSCYVNHYYCSNGNHGMNGTHGASGYRGERGTLWVIPSLNPLLSEKLVATSNLSQLTTEATDLREHRWEVRSQAQHVLGSGSVIQDRWHYYQGDHFFNVTARWNAYRPLSLFASSQVWMGIRNGQISWNLPELWSQGAIELGADHSAVIRIDAAYRETEVAHFKIGRITGIGRNLTIEVIDENALEGPIQAQFKMKYMSKGRRNWWVINWHDQIPANLIRRTGNVYTILAGELPVDDAFKKEGWIVGFEFEATHWLGQNSRSIKIDRYWHTIGKTTEN